MIGVIELSCKKQNIGKKEISIFFKWKISQYTETVNVADMQQNGTYFTSQWELHNILLPSGHGPDFPTIIPPHILVLWSDNSPIKYYCLNFILTV